MHDDPKYQLGEVLSPDAAGAGTIISADTRRGERLPPGQARTRKWPVLHATNVPDLDISNWRIDVGGLVERPLTLDWQAFRNLPRVRVFADFHCVTRWSRLGNTWEGVSVREVMKRAGVRPEANFVVVGGYDYTWTTNLPLADFLSDDALLADTHDGEPLDPDHGGPVRLVVPRLYAWKSAKWVRSIELVERDMPGYWERLGYHDRGDPWGEQRYRDEE
jgi:DMSO/TMAO reductase YedYZ molybdopterin-dependent catalytic subunit